MKAYSMDLRERVVAMYEKGDTTIRKVAQLFQVSVPWVKSMLRLKRETDSLEPKGGRRGPPSKITEKKRCRLRRLLADTPDLTQKEMVKKLRVNVHPCTLSRVLA